MKRMTKKTIAAIVVFIMAVGFIPIGAIANARTENGKELIQISEPGEFVDARIYLDGSAIAYKEVGGKKILYRYDPDQDKFIDLGERDFDKWGYSTSVYGYEQIELQKGYEITYIDKYGKAAESPYS